MQRLNNGWIATASRLPVEANRDEEGEIFVWSNNRATLIDLTQFDAKIHLYWQPTPVGPNRNPNWIATKESAPVHADADEEGTVMVWGEHSTVAGACDYFEVESREYPFWMPYPKGPNDASR
ncbi:hypothetical protein KTD31_01990 [Burkholderia multivorans]|uniref:hypothetical protein n=1 Tax=Burkholderia multivorans TaxID=87883 RepID=UPI001C21EF06|nr:hypothetical protein [Burkholderia multivorans]MBU9200175.1 hypothetical protein [Burkholderia multivorans]MDN8078703.1 hypothetical protein [Burkholderia multivorans]